MICAVSVFDLANKNKQIDQLKQKLALPEVYCDIKQSSVLNKQLVRLQAQVDEYNDLNSNAQFVTELLNEASDADKNDPTYIGTIDNIISETKAKCDQLYLQTLLSGKYDINDAIVKIHSGAGGTEACDWVSMLFRMYKMYANSKGYKVTMLDSVEGDGAGFKSVTFSVAGDNAYGYLKYEMGVHRLVRISPFDAGKRRHTSFASVEVMPKLDQMNEVQILDKDLQIDTYRSGGAGGQHVNTTDSAVRIKHIPTGIVVTCQNERSQLQNREKAMEMLASKLLVLQLQQEQEQARALKGEAKKIEWGSQIRSYVFCPYTMVKDHRTGAQTSNLTAVMDGELDQFIFEELRQMK